MNNSRLLQLLKDVEPLIKSQTQLIDYRKYRYTFKEIYALYEDKVIDINIKYSDKPYDEVKYITLASLRRYTITISKSLVRNSHVELMEEITLANNSVDISSLFSQLTENLSKVLDTSLHPLLNIILTPPPGLLEGLISTTRIPNQNYLEYLGVPITDGNLKNFQKHRNYINKIIREQVKTLEY